MSASSHLCEVPGVVKAVVVNTSTVKLQLWAEPELCFEWMEKYYKRDDACIAKSR